MVRGKSKDKDVARASVAGRTRLRAEGEDGWLSGDVELKAGGGIDVRNSGNGIVIDSTAAAQAIPVSAFAPGAITTRRIQRIWLDEMSTAILRSGSVYLGTPPSGTTATDFAELVVTGEGAQPTAGEYRLALNTDGEPSYTFGASEAIDVVYPDTYTRESYVTGGHALDAWAFPFEITDAVIVTQVGFDISGQGVGQCRWFIASPDRAERLAVTDWMDAGSFTLNTWAYFALTASVSLQTGLTYWIGCETSPTAGETSYTPGVAGFSRGISTNRVENLTSPYWMRGAADTWPGRKVVSNSTTWDIIQPISEDQSETSSKGLLFRLAGSYGAAILTGDFINVDLVVNGAPVEPGRDANVFLDIVDGDA